MKWVRKSGNFEVSVNFLDFLYILILNPSWPQTPFKGTVEIGDTILVSLYSPYKR